MVEGETAISVEAVVRAFHEVRPHPEKVEQRVSFGTSGHRGSSLVGSFNASHISAIAQSVVDYRQKAGYSGPLFLGHDTHALSQPAWEITLEVLIANGVDVCVDGQEGVVATPLVSRAILQFNAEHDSQRADGLIITPSHNPPEDGGIKYNPAHGGPAEGEVTAWIERQANVYLTQDLQGVKRIPLAKARERARPYDFVETYVAGLDQVVDMTAIAASGLKLGVDPMGGTALPIWQAIAERYSLDVSIVNDQQSPDFAFMPPDHDGKIRMDCSSTAAMVNLLAMKNDFDLAFGNDPDADRHGIVDANGLMNPNHFLAVAIDYLLAHRDGWSAELQVGKTLVSSAIIDRVVVGRKRAIYEVPVGFKWFVEGLYQGWLAFGGEESAGASFLTQDGRPWSTDKDGIILCLLAAESMAVTGKSPSQAYQVLTQRYGIPFYQRLDAPCSAEQKAAFKRLSSDLFEGATLAGDAIEDILVAAPGNHAPIGGVKVVTARGWFAARPSGTEYLYKIYAESFVSEQHLKTLVDEAQRFLDQALTTS
ncbi:phosphoglucomutase, alpha-D-glucose phosphate-specific [Chromohalobacter canadensis]|uniref:Phosphoglucomutase, alpha-D-glucose phosphate-specific n=1 Tax=Chromohalobacter canadensis TaxID=141389 RepID=A0ABZ0YA27_9GAMM|nr:phosphoglucomutase, alpha-D-glucose phosphate-specific [Chromohalobacter canadensis]MCK0770246.1 phosphoglucomutase, alpha-D-glucose phosphate-specific [Chromohalobacter canadensis]WQH08923.1 phosphoglucomutase, alpha-D-glucose phosphate-specific [Chromohalobacter canadensis]